MPAKNPRVMAVLEPPLYEWLTRFARAEGVSVSLKVRDLLREAYEMYEDEYLTSLARARARTFDRRTALTTEQMKARLGLNRRPRTGKERTR